MTQEVITKQMTLKEFCEHLNTSEEMDLFRMAQVAAEKLHEHGLREVQLREDMAKTAKAFNDFRATREANDKTLRCRRLRAQHKILLLDDGQGIPTPYPAT